MALYLSPVQYNRKSPAENEIDRLFNGQLERLRNRKYDLSQDITNWGNSLMNRIGRHVQEQQKLLDEEYQKQKRNVTERYEQFVANARLHDGRKDNDQIRQLIERCNSLKFGLAVLEFNEQVIPFVQVLKEGQALPKKQAEQRIVSDISRPNSSEKHNYDTGTNLNSSRSSASVVTSPTPEQTGLYSSTITVQTSTDHGDSNGITKSTDGLMEKCPTCFMIFPKYMSSADRNLHANEHFKD